MKCVCSILEKMGHILIRLMSFAVQILTILLLGMTMMTTMRNVYQENTGGLLIYHTWHTERVELQVIWDALKLMQCNHYGNNKGRKALNLNSQNTPLFVCISENQVADGLHCWTSGKVGSGMSIITGTGERIPSKHWGFAGKGTGNVSWYNTLLLLSSLCAVAIVTIVTMGSVTKEYSAVQHGEARLCVGSVCSSLTHCVQVMHICVSTTYQHWFE